MLMSARTPLGELENAAEFAARHIGPTPTNERHMLSVIGAASRQALIDAVVPRTIARTAPMQLPAAVSEAQALAELKALAARNKVSRASSARATTARYTPGVILRNILENPAWYTAYTPYQAEISQGRLEALVNFQTMVCDLTGMAIANASMLDEATAAAEAMTLAKRSVQEQERHHHRRRRLPPADHRGGADARQAAGHQGGAAASAPELDAGQRRLLRRAGAVPVDQRLDPRPARRSSSRRTPSRPPSSSPPTCWR